MESIQPLSFRDHRELKDQYVDEAQQLHIISFTSSTTSGINVSSASSKHQYHPNQPRNHSNLDENNSINGGGSGNVADESSKTTLLNTSEMSIGESAERREERMLRSIENVQNKILGDRFSTENKLHRQTRADNNENRRPFENRSPLKSKAFRGGINKIIDVPEFEDFMRTIDKLNKELKQQTEMIAHLKRENSILIEQRDKINSSLAINLVDTEHAYHEHERNRFGQILSQKEAECVSLQNKIEQISKRLNEERQANVQLNEQINTALSQIDRLKRTNKELFEANRFVKMQVENMQKQIDIFEQEKVLAAEIQRETDELLKQNGRLQFENDSLSEQMEALKNEIMHMRKTNEDELAKVRTRMSECESKSKKKIKEYESVLEDALGENKKLNEERASFLKSLQSLQDERQKLTDELNRCRESYETRLDDCKKTIAQLSELSSDQQKRIDIMMLETAQKEASVEKQVQTMQDEAKSAMQAQQLAEERLNGVEMLHAKELDETRRKLRAEVDKWKKKCDETAVRNAELARANTELRSRIHLYETECKKLVDKCAGLKCDLETAQRQKKDLRDDYERKETLLRKEKELLEQQLKESKRKTSSLHEVNERLEKQSAALQAQAERGQQLEKAAKQGETYKIKYNNVKSYIRRMLYESNQMAMNGNGNCDWAHGRVLFFSRLIKDLQMDSNDDADS